MAQHQKPRNECPFSRACEPNALGGSDPTVYVGQAAGPFWLPCHCDVDFSDPNWKEDLAPKQCAGLAIYRANTHVEFPPNFGDRLLKLPADKETCFASPVELLQHHKQISRKEAIEVLVRTPTHELLQIELAKIGRVPGAKIHITRRDD